MAAAVARRLAATALALLASSFAVFAALYVAPGDPIRFLSAGRSLTPAAQHSLRAQYHLDDPFLERYARWVLDALHGDFGRAIISRQPVADLVGPRIVTTLELLALAVVLSVAGGVALGVAAGVRDGGPARVVLAASGVGVAAPSFVVAVILVAVFATGLGWFPTVGTGSGLGGRLHHVVLPAVTLALGGIAGVARITRAALLDELGGEGVVALRSRGLRERVVVRHALRNAALPVLTAAGSVLAALLAGSVVVESAFGLGGLGSLLVDNVGSGDFAVVQAVALLFLVILLLVNTAVDLLYAVLDPRLRETHA